MNEVSCIAAVLKVNQQQRRNYSKRFWGQMNEARGDVERVFSHFFYNKFREFSQWRGKSKTTFDEFAAQVVCCVIMYNVLIKNQHAINRFSR